jgi:hypothetical protein
MTKVREKIISCALEIKDQFLIYILILILKPNVGGNKSRSRHALEKVHQATQVSEKSTQMQI